MDAAFALPPAGLDPTRIRAAAPLLDSKVPLRIEVIESTPSTNDLALELGEGDAEEGLVIFAEHQSRGRGRRGDAWLAEPRKDLLLSILVRPEAPLAHWCRLSHLAGLAVARAVEAATGLQAKIKWPNDLYLDDRKLAGLLVETRAAAPKGDRAFAVVGIGLNVNTIDFPDSLDVPAVSLAGQRGEPVDRDHLAGTLLHEFFSLYPDGLDQFTSIRQAIQEQSYLQGRQVRVEVGDQVHWGTVEGLGPQGELLLSSSESGEALSLISADRVRLTDRLP